MRTFVLVAAFVAVTMCPEAAADENGRMLTVVGYFENAVLLPVEFPIQAKSYPVQLINSPILSFY